MSNYTTLKILAMVSLLASSLPSNADAYQVYFNDFQNHTAGSEWSSQSIDTAPNPAINPWWGTYLGQFSGNDAVTLTLAGLAPGMLTLSFDTYFIRSWDGNDTIYGKDYFKVSVLGGQTLLYDTFSNGNPAGQSYIGNGSTDPGYAVAGNSSMTGAAQRWSLGYDFNDGINHTNDMMDSVYTFSFSFYNTLETLAFQFAGIGLQNNLVTGLQGEQYYDESWGLDNVGVNVAPVPEPSTLILLFGGLAGLFGYQVRSSRKGKLK